MPLLLVKVMAFLGGCDAIPGPNSRDSVPEIECQKVIGSVCVAPKIMLFGRLNPNRHLAGSRGKALRSFGRRWEVIGKVSAVSQNSLPKCSIVRVLDNEGHRESRE